MKKEIEIQKEFGKWGGAYGKLEYSFWCGDVSGKLIKDQKTSIKLLKPKKNQRILDVACGNGWAVLEIAKITRPEIVYGIDITKELIREAKRNAKKGKINNVKFIQTSVERLPFENKFFDGIISNNAAHHFHKPTKMFREILRVLRKGKKFILIDTCAGSKLIKEFERKLKKEEKAHYKFFGLKEIKDILLRAGFSKVEGYRKNYNFYITAIK